MNDQDINNWDFDSDEYWEDEADNIDDSEYIELMDHHIYSSGGKYQANRSASRQQSRYIPKWYLSIPIILLSIFIYPVSIVLTILRAKDFRKQHRSYRRNSFIAVGIHMFILLAMLVGAITSTNWERSFEDALFSGDYDKAYNMLDDKFGTNIDAVCVDYYFRIFKASSNYNMADDILEEYYQALDDKTQFDPAVKSKYLESMDSFPLEEKIRTQYVFNMLGEAIRKKANEEQAALDDQRDKEAAQIAKEQEKEKLKKEEKEKAALAKAEETRAKQLSEVREAVDNYLEKDSSKNLKKIAKQNKELVEEYLIEMIEDYLVYNIQNRFDAERLRDKLQKLCDLYLGAFSVNSSKLSEILELSQKLIPEYKELDKLKSKYPFPISKANSCVWQEFYISQRLETSYSDNILGAIQKEIDSYNRDNTSDWVAYNVEYLPLIGATRGDDVTIIHSSELNPFSQSGTYNLLCYIGNETTSLTDSQGFVFDAPVVYMVSNDSQLYEDYNNYTMLINSISVLKTEMENWSKAASDCTPVPAITNSHTELTSVTIPTVTTPPIKVQIEGYVIFGCGGLNVRSGPGIQYDKVSRLDEGTGVVITETQQVDDSQWGNIGYGWVSMDYIAEGTPPLDSLAIPPQNTIDQYVGHWGDSIGQRCMMQIDYHDNQFFFELSWGNGASSTAKWSFTGSYDGYANTVAYSNGRHYTEEYLESGKMIETVHYTNGSGYFFISHDGYMYWEDFTENRGTNCAFEKNS